MAKATSRNHTFFLKPEVR